MAVVGAMMLVLLVLFAVIGPLLWSADPLKQSLTSRNKPPGWVSASGQKHPLGTDQVGRDLTARLMVATRESLAVAILSVLGAAVIGVLAAAIAGYRGGIFDAVIMRIVDVQMSFPFILIAIIWASVVGTGRASVILIVALRGWVGFARIVRSRILAVRELDYVTAAKSAGASQSRVVLRHVLPQTFSAIIILVALEMGSAVILESTLGFLGLGIQPPTPTLGNMLSDGQSYLQTAWWLVIMPGALLTIIVIAVNTLGDGLRDTLDPQTARVRR
jgi:peptide/nickel transport system permease protein